MFDPPSIPLLCIPRSSLASFKTSFMRGSAHPQTSSFPTSSQSVSSAGFKFGEFSTSGTFDVPQSLFPSFGNNSTRTPTVHPSLLIGSSGNHDSPMSIIQIRRGSMGEEETRSHGSPSLPARDSSSFGHNSDVLPPINSSSNSQSLPRYSHSMKSNGGPSNLDHSHQGQMQDQVQAQGFQATSSTHPPIELLLRLARLFFSHSAVASVLMKELFLGSLGGIVTSGSELERGVLHALLACSIPFSTLEDARESLWFHESYPTRMNFNLKEAIARIHAKKARELVEQFRFSPNNLEEVLPTSLILTCFEMGETSQVDLLKEISWSSMTIRRLGFHNLPLLPGTGTAAWSHVPSVALACQSFWQWLERRDRFWIWYLQDRALQVSMSWPNLLQDEDVLTSLPCHEDRLEQGVSHSRWGDHHRNLTPPTFSLPSSIFLRSL